MENPFEISKKKVVDTVKHMASMMNCDYKTAYDKYTHTLIKMNVAWEDIKPLLNSNLKKVQIQVIQMPAFVEYDCPYCGVGVKIDYDDFENMMSASYWGDWLHEKVKCDACGEIFQIDDVECD
ncbi:MAG TPA: hypothetical protein IAC14_02570 [Candidatus Scybalomonas excrementigallinarum]|nr:hypothetical protein [Candidatus Scybalomonas excrementigallinarum]